MTLPERHTRANDLDASRAWHEQTESAMQTIVLGKALLLLVVANGVPVAATKLLNRRMSHPIDGGIALADGQPLFGPSKTLRGFVVSVLATETCALILGLSWGSGALFALAAMAGDLFSSFLKRRLALAPSSKAIVLDQVPESLFPLLAFRHRWDLTPCDILACVLVFFVLEISFSPFLYWLHVRDRPY